ncbi:type I-G CRISPR-associated protein, Cas3-extension family [Bythopirellula goksoeyrii]|uniref:Uncharacterized protein n=1 Tax=Bythopirellula goksoeyrii TaxID=1400387 RepID=A0A5B9QED3_9BACT|nr:hypothetical protein Pr1d_25610 [Bythopirellula goksoeyrii]
MELPGLRADSLLGFLAALGACRTLEVGLAWRKSGPFWIADIDTDDPFEVVVSQLLQTCQTFPAQFSQLAETDPALKFEEGVNKWREFALQYPDWACAIGCEAGEDFRRSPILMSKGGGHQHPLKMVQGQCSKISREDIELALLGPWKRIPDCGLRLDPLENRPHADNWSDPSIKNQDSQIVALGPTRLAFESFPLVPTLNRSLHAIFDRTGKIVSWALWENYLLPRAITARLFTSPPAYVSSRRHISKGNWSVSPAKAVGNSR